MYNSDLYYSFSQLFGLNSRMTVEVIKTIHEILHILLIVHNRKSISHSLLPFADVLAHLGK